MTRRAPTRTHAARAEASVLLSHAAPSVGVARNLLAGDLAAHGIRHRAAADAVLVLSELVCNAVKHARPLSVGGLRVGWDIRPGAVRLAVTDGGAPTRPAVRHPSLSALGGRGLDIVAKLADDWGTEPSEGGTTVWAVVPTARIDNAESTTVRR